MAKHEGYNLDRPSEFFEKYGSYVLSMLRMIKFGVSVAGFVVPPLAHFKLAEGFDGAKERLKYVEKQLEPHFDTAIAYLERLQGMDTISLDDNSDHADQIQALEGAELRQVATFLKNRDEGMVLGNLYRTTTTEGHVKWVCLDHYHENYSAVALKAFAENVELNKGQYDENTGTLKITLKSLSLAKEFYSLLIKARNIQELDLTLDWDMTYSDLKLLRDTLQAVNVSKISIDCGNFTGPATDTFNRGKRCDPLVHIAMNTKLHSASFYNIDGFFSKSTAFPKRPTPLREIRIDSVFSPKSHGKNLVILLEQSSLLTTMTLATSADEFYETLDLVRTNTTNHRQFQSLQVLSPMFRIKIDSASLQEARPSSFGSDSRAATLSSYGRHLQQLLISDSFTDRHADLFLNAMHAPVIQLRLLQFEFSESTLTFRKLTANGAPLLEMILRDYLPRDCRVEFKCPIGIRGTLGLLPWIFHLSDLVHITVFDIGDLNSVVTAAGTFIAETQAQQQHTGAFSVNHIADRRRDHTRSRVQELRVSNGALSLDLVHLSQLAHILSLMPGLTKFAFRVFVTPETAALSVLMAAVDYSRMKELTFTIVSWGSGDIRSYRFIVDSIPIPTWEGEVVLETLTLRSSYFLEWNEGVSDDRKYILREIQKRNPKCKVVFTGYRAPY
ncbi:hypothetical protein CPC16_005267 [Podila verticillata]|nr:hypothetical protein CPC16_005267 [Podila verticillata]